MRKIIEKKICQRFVLKICFPLETYHVQPLAHIAVPDEISPKTDAWGAFGSLA
jgi:hypothetical protein